MSLAFRIRVDDLWTRDSEPTLPQTLASQCALKYYRSRVCEGSDNADG